MTWQLVGNIAGKNGRDAIAPDVDVIAQRAAALIPRPKDGSDGRDGQDVDRQQLQAELLSSLEERTFSRHEVASLVAGEVAKAVAAINVTDLVAESVTRAMSQIRQPVDGRDGKDANPEFVKAEVARVVAAIPIPKDGKDGANVERSVVSELVTSEVEKVVAAIPRPKDGVGLLGAVIDREGQLIVTLSDGTTKLLGTVVGRDVDMREVARLITEKVALIPVKEGAPGKDGRDATTDNIKVVKDSARSWSLCFKDGTPIEGGAIEFDTPLYRGVYVVGKTYERADLVTTGGSLWHCNDPTSTKPGDGSPFWTLVVKEGRRGKPGEPGPQGNPGRDLTNMDTKGTKW